MSWGNPHGSFPAHAQSLVSNRPPPRRTTRTPNDGQVQLPRQHARVSLAPRERLVDHHRVCVCVCVCVAVRSSIAIAIAIVGRSAFALLGLKCAFACDYSAPWVGGVQGDAACAGSLGERDEGRVVVFYPLFDLRDIVSTLREREREREAQAKRWKESVAVPFRRQRRF